MPARTRSRCVAPGCQQGVAVGRTLCDDHTNGRQLWNHMPRLCSLPECERVHASRGLCQPHYDKYRRSGDFERVRDFCSESPFYADRPCPACGDLRTVPFDPRRERAGRGPSTDLATCVACHHVWSLALPVSGEAPHAPGMGSGNGRRSPRCGVGAAVPTTATLGTPEHAAMERRMAAQLAEVRAELAQPGRANSRAGEAPAVTGTTGAA